MKKSKIVSLPPIAVEERPEKLTLSLPVELKHSMERFGEFFADASGQTPISFNAIVIGILTGYLEGHGDYQKWLKVLSRTTAPGFAAGGPSA